MASTYNRRINLYINGKEVSNDIKSVQSAMFKLRNEQRMMAIGSDEYVRHAQKIRQLRAIIDKHNADLRKTERSWISLKGTADKFNRYFGMITAGIASLTGIALGFRKASDEANKFEERLDNLSALTGLEGEQLEWLGQKAKETSVEITESGIRIKQSAADILDAYTKMGSQRPELLKDKEALHEVTKNAIILSEAAKSELEPAVSGLAMAMNQHNIAASESGRVINAMAAGSKEGAGDIPYLTKAIEKSGTTLSLMNVSLEENIGLIESVAPYYARAELAGNSLDKVFLKLKANQIGYKNGVFSVEAALDELEKRFAKGETAAELFGVEHAKMGELLVKNRDEVKRYTDAVTGTNVAIEQAVKNTNNNAAKLAQARNEMNLVLIEFGEKLNPAFLKSTNLVTYLIKALMRAPKWFKDNQMLIIALAGAVAAYNAALIKQILLEGRSLAVKTKNIIIDKALAVASTAKVVRMRLELALMKKQTAAQIAQANALKKSIMYEQLFGKALLTNPVGIAIAAITTLVVAIKAYDKYSRQAMERERERKQAVEDLTDANMALKDTYDNIQENIATLNTLSVQEKLDLQEKINKTIELAEAELSLQEAKQLDIQEENTRATLWQKTANLLKSGGNAYASYAANVVDAVNNGAEAAGTMQEGIDSLRERLAALKRQGMEIGDILNAERIGDAIGSETMAQLEEKLNRYNVALKNVARGSEDYIRIQQKIDEVNKLIGKSTPQKNDEQIKKELEVLEASYSKKQSLIRQNHLEGKTSEDEYNAQLLKAELDFLAEKIRIYNAGSKEYQEAINASLELQVKTDKKIKDLLLEAEMDYAVARTANIKDEFARAEQEETNRWEKERTALEKRLIDKQNLSDEEIRLNDTINKLIEEKEAEHQQKMNDLKSGKNISDLENLVDAATPIDQNFATLDEQQAFFDARLALIEAQYEREKELAGNNQSALLAAERRYARDSYQVRKEQIDAEYQLIETRIATAQNYAGMLGSIVDQESALGKALFLFSKGLAIAQVWVNYAKESAAIALAAAEMNAVSFGIAGTAWGTVQQAMAKKRAVQNTAVIAAQALAGFAEGGYTGNGNKYEVAGNVHKGEYVVPADLLKNPMVANMAATIEALRTRQVRVNNALPQYASGGMVSTGGKYSENEPDKKVTGNNNTDMLAELKAHNQALLAALANIKIYTAIEDVNNGQKRFAEIQETRGFGKIQ